MSEQETQSVRFQFDGVQYDSADMPEEILQVVQVLQTNNLIQQRHVQEVQQLQISKASLEASLRALIEEHKPVGEKVEEEASAPVTITE